MQKSTLAGLFWILDYLLDYLLDYNYYKYTMIILSVIETLEYSIFYIFKFEYISWFIL